MYRHVIHDIAKAGYHVIAPDYRGAGQTSLSPTQDDKEDTGYDKFSMAADLHALYKEVLGVDKAFIVGIDIGSMVATALALRFREDVIGLFASGEWWAFDNSVPLGFLFVALCSSFFSLLHSSPESD
jgi:pimeloyl-ACP methyl ester carboxylesterase